MRHFFLPVTVCALAHCAGREHAKAMRERIDGEVQKRWRRSAALVSAAAGGDEDLAVNQLDDEMDKLEGWKTRKRRFFKIRMVTNTARTSTFA